ncbi:MAG: DUF2384 domain-containing protein [Acidobacteriota bacterium]|nr:DUF2384 domain-containing protein [Acidobacteriota bacterium]
MHTFDSRPRPLPRLTNGGGDPLLFTTDHFDIASGCRQAIEQRLASIPGVDPPGESDREDGWTFFEPSEEPDPGATGMRRILGSAYISGQRMTLETNSMARADDLRKRVERACGDLLQHRAREHSDPIAEFQRKAQSGAPPQAPVELGSSEMHEMMLAVKQQHYANWTEEPLPALAGRTPRQAAQTEAGRRELDLLLKEMENMERRAPTPGYDFSEIRRKLGLD